MSYEYIQVDTPADHVACVTLDNPSRLNAINRTMMRELDRAVRSIARDDDIHVWMLKGAPRKDGRPCFSAGVDMKAVAEGTRMESHMGPRVSNAMDDMLKPSIAVIDGVASTGGVELALACDFRLLGEAAEISDWHLKTLGAGLGGWGSPTRWLELVGPSVTKEIILTGRVLDAENALRTGFANAIYSSEELFDKALEMARTMAAMNPSGVRAALAHIQQSGAPSRDYSLKLATQIGRWFESAETFGERAQKALQARGKGERS